MAIQPGTRLGPYEVVAQLGAGGMGEVWRGRDTRLDREVAIKILPDSIAANETARARFEREAKVISSMSHPHICVLYDVGHEGVTHYLVMELIEGESLSERLKRGPLPPADVLGYGSQIADALDRAHKQGIVHRDLKPGNVMLTKDGAKLLDFGLARPVAEATPVGSADRGGDQGRDADHRGHDRRDIPVHGARAARGSRRPTRAPTSSRWERCCTRWRPGVAAFEERIQGRSDRRDRLLRRPRRSPRYSRRCRRRSTTSHETAWRRIPTTAGRARTTWRANCAGSPRRDRRRESLTAVVTTRRKRRNLVDFGGSVAGMDRHRRARRLDRAARRRRARRRRRRSGRSSWRRRESEVVTVLASAHADALPGRWAAGVSRLRRGRAPC